MATMTAKKTEIDTGDESPVKDRLLDNLYTQQVKRFLLASVGAVVLAQEEIEEFVNRLVEKGEIGVKDGKKLIEETFKKRREQAKDGIDKVEKQIDDRVIQILDKMNVATKKDVDDIQKTLEKLVGQMEKATKGAK